MRRDSVRKVRHAPPFKIGAMVVLPDHVHAIWTLPSGDNNYPLRWSLIKAGFSRQMEKTYAISVVRIGGSLGFAVAQPRLPPYVMMPTWPGMWIIFISIR